MSDRHSPATTERDSPARAGLEPALRRLESRVCARLDGIAAAQRRRDRRDALRKDIALVVLLLAAVAAIALIAAIDDRRDQALRPALGYAPLEEQAAEARQRALEEAARTDRRRAAERIPPGADP